MVTDFSGFTNGVIGKKLPSDTTLNNMKKADLIQLLHLAQHNYSSLLWFYNNATNVNIKELSRLTKIQEANVIDEYANKLIPRLTDAIHKKDVGSMTNLINTVAEQMKGGEV